MLAFPESQLPPVVLAVGGTPAKARHTTSEERTMPFITTTDGVEIFYKDWGTGRPVVFSHGWPLNADAWDNQLELVAANGFRAIAHDLSLIHISEPTRL